MHIKQSILRAIALAGMFSLLAGTSSMASPYMVVKDDNLWKIARQRLGDGRRYIEIFEANKDQITDPNIIQIGQVLEIPDGQSAFGTDLPVVKTTVTENEKFGSAVLDILPEKFEEAGFSLGDSCDISFENGLHFFDIPYYDGYYVRHGKPVIIAYPGFGTVEINYNGGTIWDEENLSQGEGITIQMNTPGKYVDFLGLMKQEYSFDRDDYASDEEYCNFRALSGGSIKAGFIYRGASPVDNSRGRAAYTDKLLSENNIQAILNLADSEEEMEQYKVEADYSSPYSAALYEDGKMYLADMNAAFSSQEYKQKLVGGLRAIMNMPGPSYIHCTEGKDRTGFVCMLLEALTGASYEEMKADYMQTYKNYYGMDKESTPEKYNAISGLYFDDFLRYLCDTEDVSILKDADFSKDARDYLLEGGLTEEEISQLTEYLTGGSE